MSASVDQHRERFGVEPICETLGVSASAYYQRKTAERSDWAVEDERLLAVIRDTHKRNYEAYGYRRFWRALHRAGEHAPRCQVQPAAAWWPHRPGGGPGHSVPAPFPSANINLTPISFSASDRRAIAALASASSGSWPPVLTPGRDAASAFSAPCLVT